ncbi:ras-related protein Rab-30 [Halyomorpha halys]|uniref:ras-related protein Rab-30 n=1 Tax=Halyomorpha halys TaxID=286706 RepID=UPI0006D4CB5E|nr:ras-related protein Rab-30 [Halyomorpha halys]
MATVKTPEQKVILCGEFGVGKSSLFRRYAFNTFVASNSRKSTLGLDHINKEYSSGGKRIKLQLWDTGGMERVASITSSYYKFAEAAILVFSLDNPASFHVLSQHLLDVVTYAENAKIFLCGNKLDLVGQDSQVTDADMDNFCEQCHNLISVTYKTSCKTGEGVDEMFADIAQHLITSNRSRLELQALEELSFKVTPQDEPGDPACLC